MIRTSDLKNVMRDDSYLEAIGTFFLNGDIDKNLEGIRHGMPCKEYEEIVASYVAFVFSGVGKRAPGEVAKEFAKRAKKRGLCGD